MNEEIRRKVGGVGGRQMFQKEEPTCAKVWARHGLRALSTVLKEEPQAAGGGRGTRTKSWT